MQWFVSCRVQVCIFNWKMCRILCCNILSVLRCDDGGVEDQNKAPHFVGVFNCRITKKWKWKKKQQNVESWIVRKTAQLYRWFMRFLHVRSHILVLCICTKFHCMPINTMFRRIECLRVRGQCNYCRLFLLPTSSFHLHSQTRRANFHSLSSQSLWAICFNLWCWLDFEPIILTMMTTDKFIYAEWVCTSKIIISMDSFVFCWQHAWKRNKTT